MTKQEFELKFNELTHPYVDSYTSGTVTYSWYLDKVVIDENFLNHLPLDIRLQAEKLRDSVKI